MRYWLHRITGGDYAQPYTQPLLSQGILSIGWKGLSNDDNKSFIQEKGIEGVEAVLRKYEWELNRNRHCLSRFISEMKQGDLVVVPSPGHFSIYKVMDDVVFSNESIDIKCFVDYNGIQASKKESDGYYSFINNQGEEVDLGFYRRVKPLVLDLSRYDGIDPRLYSKLRTLMTNIEISDVGPIIDEILKKGSQRGNDSDTGNGPIEKALSVVPLIHTTLELLSMSLSIPNYQRPYVWSEENVDQMLNDIMLSMEQSKEKYRLGSIILYDNNIVDGQQRLTTLALVKIALQRMDGRTNELKPNLTYNHSQSFEHIRKNFNFINDWLLRNPNKKAFEEYLDNHCVCSVLKISGRDGMSMAFKLFDSQNGRGKPLEPYNLLKAYHLRAMDSQPTNEKIICDRTWEQATRYCKSDNIQTYDILKHLFDEQLYRSRVWSRNKCAWNFTKKRIDEFKGMNIDKYHSPLYPFQNYQLLFYMTEKFYQGFLAETMPTCSRFVDNDDTNISPFTQITQPIVNGKEFFDYIRTYAEIYKRLFIELDTYQLREFKSFYKIHCLKYDGHWRTGDNYVREMYKSIIMCIFDKFGENVLNKYYRTLYLLTYIVRRLNEKVFYQTVAKHPQELFAIIHNAKSECDLKALDKRIIWEIPGGYTSFKEYEDVVEELKKISTHGR